jgi:type I restriction enzyme M protein
MNLSSTIKSIQDIMRKDDGVDGDAQRLGQLTWMLFLKVFDQREEEWEDDNPSLQSPLPERYRWRNWAAYKADSRRQEGNRKSPGSELIGLRQQRAVPRTQRPDRRRPAARSTR